jgi:hypothetical protein
MADTKTSGETAAGALDGTELVRIVQGGNNRKATTGAIGIARVATRLLSSSDILNSFTTPITIVPAPGAGFALVLLGSAYNYVFGTTPYTSRRSPRCGTARSPNSAMLTVVAAAPASSPSRPTGSRLARSIRPVRLTPPRR